MRHFPLYVHQATSNGEFSNALKRIEVESVGPLKIIKDKQEQDKLQGVSKKRYFSDFLSYFSSRGRILLFHMCFGIRILSPFHLAIQKVSIQNLNCPKNAKNACADMIFIPAQSSLRKAGIKIMSAHAFLGQLRF